MLRVLALSIVLLLPARTEARLFCGGARFPIARAVLRVATLPVRLAARVTAKLLRAEARVVIFIFRRVPLCPPCDSDIIQSD